MDEVPYRYRRVRARPPRLLLTPKVYRLLQQPGGGEAVQQVFAMCAEVMRDPGPKLHGGYSGLGGFQLEIIWSPTPTEPDLLVILGPGDGWPFASILTEYRKSRDEAVLKDLVPLALA